MSKKAVEPRKDRWGRPIVLMSSDSEDECRDKNVPKPPTAPQEVVSPVPFNQSNHFKTSVSTYHFTLFRPNYPSKTETSENLKLLETKGDGNWEEEEDEDEEEYVPVGFRPGECPHHMHPQEKCTMVRRHAKTICQGWECGKCHFEMHDTDCKHYRPHRVFVPQPKEKLDVSQPEETGVSKTDEPEVSNANKEVFNDEFDDLLKYI